MTTEQFVLWGGAWIALCLVATVINLAVIAQAVRRVRRIKSDREKITTASVLNFQAADGWVRARVRLQRTEAWSSFETWVVGIGDTDGEWQRLPDMTEASPSWSAWLSHELVAENTRRAAEAFSENEKHR